MSISELTTNELVKLQGPARTFLLQHITGYRDLPKDYGAKNNYAEATSRKFIQHFSLKSASQDKLQDAGITFGDLKKKIDRWFRNNKDTSEVPQTIQTDQTLLSLPAVMESSGPRLTFNPVPPKKSGRLVFSEAIASDLKACTMKYLKDNQLPTTAYLGIYQKLLTQRWTTLQPDEQKEWQDAGERAHELTHDNDASSVELLHNQEVLPTMLNQLFRNLIGNNHNQIGNAVFHLQMGLQAPNDEIQCYTLCVSSDDRSHIEGYSVNYDQQIARPFMAWATAVLSETHHNDTPTIGTTESGIPYMPKFMLEGISENVLRQICETYFEALWSYFRVNSTTDLPETIPWEDIATHPTDYFDTTQIASDIYIRKPSLLSVAELQRLYMFLAADEEMLKTDVVFTFQRPSERMKETVAMEINAGNIQQQSSSGSILEVEPRPLTPEVVSGDIICVRQEERLVITVEKNTATPDDITDTELSIEGSKRSISLNNGEIAIALEQAVSRKETLEVDNEPSAVPKPRKRQRPALPVVIPSEEGRGKRSRIPTAKIVASWTEANSNRTAMKKGGFYSKVKGDSHEKGKENEHVPKRRGRPPKLRK